MRNDGRFIPQTASWLNSREVAYKATRVENRLAGICRAPSLSSASTNFNNLKAIPLPGFVEVIEANCCLYSFGVVKSYSGACEGHFAAPLGVDMIGGRCS